MLTEAFLSRLDALRLAIRHPAQGGAGGVRRSRGLGSSAEFSDFRQYTPGDDVRRLDWNAYARFDKLFMRLFTEEQESAVTVLVDGSGSMETKKEQTLQTAEALSYLTLTGEDKLQIIFLHENGNSISPWYASRRDYPRAAAFLAAQPFAGAAVLADCLKAVERLPKGLALLLTDGYQAEGLNKVLALLRYRQQEAAVIQLLSAFEMQPDLEGALRLVGAEGEPPLEIVADASLLRQYHETLGAFLRACQGECRKNSAAYVLLDSRRPFEEAFLSALYSANLI